MMGQCENYSWNNFVDKQANRVSLCVKHTMFHFIFAGGHEGEDLMQPELLPAYKSWYGATNRPYVVL